MSYILLYAAIKGLIYARDTGIVSGLSDSTKRHVAGGLMISLLRASFSFSYHSTRSGFGLYRVSGITT